ncbi:MULTISPECIES: SDR family oxidoreductase [Bifidobacterium]|jgi:NADP-dependent 3-hydroxy acid dehydrogenase YdfG|uniref:SDR family NAD(P)-dependent oxidoreductase n=1 Tax=Bifidobacterium tibiigranuli TaxID=2172043 RepID=A0A5N6S6T6_9BIFI|nr:SDR family oxidoreductase [Bifidobacterium tibiigranuli]KAE8130265.1 SDR family NAD(P)-dependent oxidoreductase [Bifidobacterium tibiigranuli]KAE8130376.1 SDR family NAD(P)-dependent oxidoreductase [Bifidobacterium tibiigranuli]MCI1212040.1 SDR family oxidoreductase [Bifidobacterium tibiigranuli]MCI1221457.1 SDR family oxidoreductase [Bifidobacterium tibiigranuli]MCI1232603.1 SDR family oxidoreductase [Bifidobacterium tibiigranuli]
MTYSDYTTALVTGASSGMGNATVRRFTERGLTVHAVARDAKRLGQLAEETGAIPHVLDLADTDAIEREFTGMQIDILVNHAGVSRPGNILDATRQDLENMVNINLGAILQLVRILLPGMVERDLGHIVNTSSIAGLYNFFGHTGYHATKAAVHQLSRQLRNDTVGKRIRVTEICPGRVETEIFARNVGGSPQAIEAARKEYFDGYESLTTDDIVNAIDFAIDSPRRMNVGLMEIMPTFQVPGGLTFNRRG